MRAQLARIDAVLIQAVIAAALSFAHLHDIANAAGRHGWKAWAYLVSVDLLLVAAWRQLRSGTTKGAAWCWFVISLTASLGANVATAGLLDVHAVPAWLRILVAGWPAVAFLGGTLLAHTRNMTPSEPEVDSPGAELAESDPVPESVPVSAPPEPTEPESTPAPPIRPAPAVPAALVEHACKVAAEHHTRTGTVIDIPTLRQRLGVPVPLAEAIAVQLRDDANAEPVRA